MSSSTLLAAAEAIARWLEREQQKIALAESCTGGRMAAALTQIAGISRFFCGSCVVYRESTKTAWLGVEEDLLQSHTAESPAASLALARGVLRRTPEATLSVGVTGHLGPGAPDDRDGLVYAVFCRLHGNHLLEATRDIRLQSSTRSDRQAEASQAVLSELLAWLEGG